MNDQLPMFGQRTCEDSGSAISLPVLESGVTPCDLPDGQMTGKCGPEAAPAPVSAQPAKAKGLEMLVTSGRIGFGSSASVALQSCLVSKLKQRLDMAGSTLFKLTWSQPLTPLGRRYLRQRALGHRTSGQGCTSLPTPVVNDELGSQYAYGPKNPDGTRAKFLKLPGAAQLASLPTPNAVEVGLSPEDKLRGNTEADNHYYPHDLSNAVQLVDSGQTATGGTAETASGGQLNPEYSRWLMGLPPVFCDCAVTATASSRRSRPNSSKQQEKQ